VSQFDGHAAWDMIVGAAGGKGPPRKGFQRVMLTEPRVLGTVCGNRLRRRLIPLLHF